MRVFHKGVSARLVCVRVGIGWGGGGAFTHEYVFTQQY